MSKFSNRLEMALDMAGMSARELAKKTGLTESTISQYRSGVAKPRGTDRVYILAEALNVSPSWLIGFDTPAQPGENDAMNLFASLSVEDQLKAIDYMAFLKSKEQTDV